MTKNKEIEINLLENGEVLVSRFDFEHNADLLDMAKEIGIENIDELELFLESGNHIEHILGDVPLCG